MFRAHDSVDNRNAFGSERNQQGENSYPQVRMCCLMEVTSHLILGSEFDARAVGEMTLAERLIGRAVDHSVTLFDRGYYSLGLLDSWHKAGEERHWVIPARKGARFNEQKRLGENDWLVSIPTSPQARKKFTGLSTHISDRLTRYTLNGKTYRILSSLLEPLRYPYDELVDLYAQRWEIELGYREIKQTLLQSAHTLRSKKLEMVHQELWGVLLAYNLIRIVMIEACAAEEPLTPTRLSFSHCLWHVTTFLARLPMSSPGNLPKHYAALLETLRMLTLPAYRPVRVYPREVRRKPTKYPFKKKSQSA
ncbi:IS4 family transposase [Aliagarivorans taiwanensis]|uniref:IS4 family transposase n=1 Tax=Aliagarivorans taiwanensis TaxID=561966 RepID=UPI001FDECAF3|nr:IS4 family transposase [Aliagarivorans taiwanensis]